MFRGVQSGSRTRIVVGEITAKWQVELSNFREGARNTEKELVEEFLFADFTLLVGVHMNYYGAVWIELSRTDDSTQQLVGKLTCEALLPGWKSLQGGHIFCNARCVLKPQASSFHMLAKLDDLIRTGLLATDTLHLSIGFAPIAKKSTPSSELAAQLGGLLDTGTLSDLTVRAGGEDFSVHRIILAARAPAFKGMLDAGMSEATDGRIEVSDVDAATMRALLGFLYTGSCERVEPESSCPVGTWYYKERHMNSSDMARAITTWPSYKISKSDGVLTYFKQFTNGVEHRGALQQRTDTKWKVDVDGCEVALALRDGIMHGVHGTEEGMEPYRSEAYCAEQEVRVAEHWGNLLKAADKYCIGALVKACRDAMRSRLNVFNAACMLVFVSATSQHQFKTELLDFITFDETRLRCVKDTRGFDALDPDLVAEVMEVFLRPRGKKRKRGGGDSDSPAEAREFLDGQDWSSLSNAQLRRACVERGLATGGRRETLVAALQAQTPAAAAAAGEPAGPRGSGD